METVESLLEAAGLTDKGLPAWDKKVQTEREARALLMVQVREAAMREVAPQKPLPPPVTSDGGDSKWRNDHKGDTLPPDKRNHLTLVEIERLLQLSKLPKIMWEPIAYIHTEQCRFIGLFPSAQKNVDYLETLVLTSQNVDGWKANQVAGAMIAERTPLQRHGDMVASTMPQEGERGLRRR